MRPDVRGGVNLGAGRDDGGGMNAGGEGSFGKKQRHGLGERDAGVGHADQDFFRGRKMLVGDDGGGGALFGAGEIVLIFGEREVARFGGVGGSKAFEHGGGVANDFAIKVFCNFSGGKVHIWHFVRLPLTWSTRLTIKAGVSSSTPTFMAKDFSCRTDRLPLHGQGALQCMAAGAQFLQPQGQRRAAHDLRTRRRRRAGGARATRLATRRDRLAGSRRVAAD